MTATNVPAVRTTYNQQQMIKGFVEGWFHQFGTLPKKESIGVLYAQNALETGGTVAMWNNNVGNVKFVANKDPNLDNGKQYMMLSNVWEIIGGVKKIYNPPDPATWFRSFPTLAEVISFHLDTLKNKNFKSAWTAVESGNPQAFAHLLKLVYYYTAPEADYVKLITFYFNKYMLDTTFESTIKSLGVTPTVVAPDATIPTAPVIPTVDSFFDKFKKIFK
jgi:hypothetical protein